MPAKIVFSLFIFCWVWIGFAEVAFAQTIVGMGTKNPNPNAVLELVSENLDQGFLVPRFTTGQRTASSFAGKLSDKDNGLLVFDTDEGEFYYWYNGGWQQGIGTGSLDGKGTVWYTGNAAPRNDEGKNGDFYIHTLSGDIYRKQNGVFNVIGNMLPQQSQYTAGTGINIGADNTIINTGDLDDANEIQDLQLTGDELKITNNTGATPIDLSAYKNNDTNELIQEVNLTGETLRISDAGGDHDVDLSSFQKTNLNNGNILVGNASNVATPVTMSGDATLANDGTASVVGLQGRPVATTAPTSGNLLTWNGTAWEPQAPAGGGGSGAAWYSGNFIPNGAMPAGAADGDYFYRNNTEIVYRKVSSVWVEQGKWSKPSGSMVLGTSISEITTPTLYIGTGVPTDGSSNNGKPGDLYYDSDEDKLYIKKNSTQWNSF